MDPRPPGRASNAGLAVVGMLLGAFVLIAAASLTAVSLTGSSGAAPTDPPKVQPTARRALEAVDAQLALDGWRRRSVDAIAPGDDECVPAGGSSGATSGAQAVLERTGGTREDVEAVIALTAYRSAPEAAVDVRRAGSNAWVDCYRDVMQEESDGGTKAVLQTVTPDPHAPGVAYSYRYVEDGELEAGSIQHVVVGRLRAMVTCACPHLGAEDRWALARQVAASLAEVQGVAIPRR